MLFAVPIFAQNPPMPDPARGITIINGRIGVNTNSATAGQSLTFDGSGVVWGAGGGGGFDTNANFIVNGTWRFNNKVQIPGDIYDVSDIMSIDVDARSFWDANGIVSGDWNARILRDPDGAPSVRWETRILGDSSSSTSLNWENRTAFGSDGSTVQMNWGSMTLFDGTGFQSAAWGSRILKAADESNTLDWANRTLINSDGDTVGNWQSGIFRDGSQDSINWLVRRLYDNGGNEAVGYQNRELKDISEALSQNWNTRKFFDSTETESGDYNARTLTGGWVIDGASSANFLTNLANSAIVTWTGQGTHTMTPSINTTIVVTNGSSATLSGLTVNGNTTLGLNSSSSTTINGQTETRPNGSMLNAGVRWDPPSITGTVTNGAATNVFTGAVILNDGLTASNATIRTTNGEGTLTSGTNLVLNVDAAAGAGFIKLKGMFTASTNTPAGINIAPNVINTNGSQRLVVNIAVAYGANAGTFIFSSTAQGPKSRHFTPTAHTNTTVCDIQPFATWTLSNYVGTATVVTGEGHLETH